MTAEELLSLKVGQEVYIAGPRTHTVAKIEKIGNKYFYTDDRRKWDIKTGKQVTDYVGGTIYPSKEVYDAERALETAWSDFKNTMPYRKPEHLTLEDINKIKAILNPTKQC